MGDPCEKEIELPQCRRCYVLDAGGREEHLLRLRSGFSTAVQVVVEEGSSPGGWQHI